MLDFNVGAVVACDDVRKEMTGKDLLIGVYPGKLNAAQIPGTVALAFWIEIQPNKIGSLELDLQVELPDGSSPVNIGMKTDVIVQDSFSIFIPQIPYPVSIPGNIKLKIKSKADIEWKEIKEVGIVHTPIPAHLMTMNISVQPNTLRAAQEGEAQVQG